MDIDKLILSARNMLLLSRFGSLMDIDKLIHQIPVIANAYGFGSLMDIDKLILPGFRTCQLKSTLCFLHRVLFSFCAHAAIRYGCSRFAVFALFKSLYPFLVFGALVLLFSRILPLPFVQPHLIADHGNELAVGGLAAQVVDGVARDFYSKF